MTIPEPEGIDGLEANVWAVIARKIGRMTSIQFNVQGNITKKKVFIKIFTLPEEYRPISSIQNNYISQDGIPMMISIGSSGDIEVYANTTQEIKTVSLQDSALHL